MKNKKAFTLLEILLVVAAIAILAGIVILAINPTKQLSDTKDAARSSDVVTILNATYQYIIDNNGEAPASIATSTTEICKTGVDSSSCASLIDLSVLTDDGRYIVSMPIDPDGGVDENGTGYAISQLANGRITVEALKASNEISVTR